jgi:hypothetical protein
MGKKNQYRCHAASYPLMPNKPSKQAMSAGNKLFQNPICYNRSCAGINPVTP